MDTLPIDRSRTFREYDYPQEPGLYTPLRHFGQRVREDWRCLDGEVINACIKNGDVRDNGDGCACFRKEWGEGIAYYLIAGWHYDGYRILITGWPHVHNRDDALSSGRWTSSEVARIEQKNIEKRREDQWQGEYEVYADWVESQFNS